MRSVVIKDEKAISKSTTIVWVPYHSVEFALIPVSKSEKRRRLSIDAYFITSLTDPANRLLMLRSYVEKTRTYSVPESHIVLNPKVKDARDALRMLIDAYYELRKLYQRELEKEVNVERFRGRRATGFIENLARLFYGAKLAEKISPRRSDEAFRSRSFRYKVALNVMRDVLGLDPEQSSAEPVVYSSMLVWRPFLVEVSGNYIVFRDLSQKKAPVDRLYTGLISMDEGFYQELKSIGLPGLVSK